MAGTSAGAVKRWAEHRRLKQLAVERAAAIVAAEERLRQRVAEQVRLAPTRRMAELDRQASARLYEAELRRRGPDPSQEEHPLLRDLSF